VSGKGVKELVQLCASRVKVHGRVDAPFILGDYRRFESPHPYAFIEETDEAHKRMLRDRLPAAALEIVGDPDDDDDWCIDCTDSNVLRSLVLEGKPILRAPSREA
jgi:hypothetical protein